MKIASLIILFIFEILFSLTGIETLRKNEDTYVIFFIMVLMLIVPIIYICKI